MLNVLRRKFIIYAMLAITLVTAVLVGAINGSYMLRITAVTDSMLSFIANNEGSLPMPDNEDDQKELSITPEVQISTRYFTVKLDHSDNIGDINLKNTVTNTYETAAEYAKNAVSHHRKKGIIGNFKYMIFPKNYGKIIVFIDFSERQRELDSLMFYSIFVSVLALLTVFTLLTAISSRVVWPVIEGLEKQKLFITNAGHELKTPLAIISANTEVLEIVNGKNEWIDSIKNQTKRLDLLIKSLLKLSRMEESGETRLNFTSVDISKAVRETAALFKASAAERDFKVEADNEIFINADADCISQLTSILLDNAIKYTNSGDNITVKVVSEQKSALLSVSNTGAQISEEEAPRLFERFYRAENSRSRETGGYGIGLSIAKSIMDSHGGKIFASCGDDTITFTAVFNKN